ncbi:MAG: hypothetical protein U1E78_13305 [Gammaproteobacteria bacterium]
MKWLPVFLGVGLGVALGVIYLTKSGHDEEEWAYVPSNSADWRDTAALNNTGVEQLFYDTPVLHEELTLEEKNAPINSSSSLLSEDDLAALLEQEQGEVD